MKEQRGHHGPAAPSPPTLLAACLYKQRRSTAGWHLLSSPPPSSSLYKSRGSAYIDGLHPGDGDSSATTRASAATARHHYSCGSSVKRSRGEGHGEVSGQRRACPDRHLHRGEGQAGSRGDGFRALQQAPDLWLPHQARGAHSDRHQELPLAWSWQLSAC